MSPDVDSFVAAARRLQTSGNEQPLRQASQVKLVLEFANYPDEKAVADILRSTYGLEFELRPLVGAFGEPVGGDRTGLDRFLLLRLPRVAINDVRDKIFPFAYDLVAKCDLISAEPDLAESFYRDEPARSPHAQPEREAAFWCWAPDDDNPHDNNWALAAIKAREAWRLADASGNPGGGHGVRIFQPDTGIAEHVELAGDMLDLTHAWNFVEGNKSPADPLEAEINPGHGTGTASVVASRPAGTMTGAAPAATLVPVRCITSVAVLDQSPVAAAVDYAQRQGAHVITMSLGGLPSRALHTALQAAVKHNIIVVAAAGNCVGEVVFPARYEECIAIGGVNKRDVPWRGSCHGPQVAVSAPAEFVARANRSSPADASRDVVSGGQGTSFAVALTAGVAALWIAYHGRSALISKLRPGETLQSRFAALLKQTARVPIGFDQSNYGMGIINAEALLKARIDSAPSTVMPEAMAAGAGASSQRSIETLVAAARPGAKPPGAPQLDAPATDFDWKRYGLEAAWLALSEIRARKIAQAVAERPADVRPPGVPAPTIRARARASDALRAAAMRSGDARLRALVSSPA